jgi:molybdenum cofactor guanylyltransferase
MSTASVDAEISGYVLAGGASSRLGRDKVLLPWNDWMGGTLLDHAIARLQQMCGSVSVCGNRSDLREHLSSHIEIIPDAIAGCGPLGGIVAALESSQTEWNLFLAVDLPLIPVEFLQGLVKYTHDGRSSMPEALCILPLVEGLPQPLCGIYHLSLALGLRRALEEGRYKIIRALNFALEKETWQEPSPVSVERDNVHSAHETAANRIQLLDVDASNLSAQPSNLQPKDWFLNINTEADLHRAQELIRDNCPGIEKEL